MVGSLDVGDIERVDTTTNYRLGLDENDSGVPTGLKGPCTDASSRSKTSKSGD